MALTLRLTTYRLSVLPVVSARIWLEKRPAFGNGRFYTQGPPPPPRKPAHQPHVDGHDVRHEVHEKNTAINIPFNPPGGGGGPGIGGSGNVFPITSSPLMDAALTTIVGLAMGNYFIFQRFLAEARL